jgi:hypothetical protein
MSGYTAWCAVLAGRGVGGATCKKVISVSCRVPHVTHKQRLDLLFLLLFEFKNRRHGHNPN